MAVEQTCQCFQESGCETKGATLIGAQYYVTYDRELVESSTVSALGGASANSSPVDKFYLSHVLSWDWQA